MTTTDRQLEIMAVCQEIGGIAECNGLFLDGLARKIGERSITDMMVGELLAVYREHREWFNKVYSP